MAAAQPFPTSPNPKIKTYFPLIKTSQALFKPSGSECLHPYTLSNFAFVTESLTFMHGH